MKIARRISLTLLILSILGVFWISGTMILYLIAPNMWQSSIPLTPGEVRAGIAGTLVVPLTLALASALIWLVFVRQPADAQQTVARVSVEPSFAPAQGQDEILDAYLVTMTELLISINSADIAARVDVRPLVYAHTRQALQVLDAHHRGRVIQFLQAAHFLRGEGRLSLHEFDLSGIDLRFSDLRCANLSGVNLQHARLVGALLYGANLSNANLDHADLRMARLDRATLRQAGLYGSKLHCASLREASLRDAVLDQVNLWQADLTAADVTDEQLQTTGFIGGALLPDGRQYA